MGLTPPRNWLVLESRTGLWWRENRCGYTKNLWDAGLYTEAEAKSLHSKTADTRRDIAIPLSEHAEEVQQLAAGLLRLQEALKS